MARRRTPRRRRQTRRVWSVAKLDFPQIEPIKAKKEDEQVPQLGGFDRITLPVTEEKPDEQVPQLEGFDRITLPVAKEKPIELPQLGLQSLEGIAKLLQPVHSAEELSDLKGALRDAVRLRGQKVVGTPRRPPGEPPAFEEEEEDVM